MQSSYGPCDVCTLLDKDYREKAVYWCDYCHSWMCSECVADPFRRFRAMITRRVRSLFHSPLLFTVILITLSQFSHAQSDIVIAQQGPSYVFGRGRIWGVSGSNGVNNGYILTLSAQATGLCVGVKNNNPTSAHTFQQGVSVTPDPSSPGIFSGGTTWIATYSTIGGANSNNPAGLNFTFWAPAPGGAKIEVLIFGSTTQAGSPDTADITAFETYGVSVCPSTTLATYPYWMGNPNLADPNGYVSARRPILCDQTVTASVATATSVLLVNNTGTVPNQKVHVCSYSITGMPSTSAGLIFADGTAGTCAVLGSTRWTMLSGTTNSLALQLSAGGGGELFEQNVVSQPLCYRDTGTTSGTTVSIAYTIFQ